MSHTRLSRRQFIVSSLATGVAGITARHAQPAAATPFSIEGQDRLVTFEVIGDRERGYGVNILFQGQSVARHNQGGEFSAVFQNEDRSLEDRVENWRASSWTGDRTHVFLDGECKLSNLNTTVFVQVEYQAVATKVARKRIRFQQADSYTLWHQVTNSLECLSVPARFWSFDQLTCQDCALKKLFPAACVTDDADRTV